MLDLFFNKINPPGVCLRQMDFIKKEIERSVSLILVILGALAHFRNSFILPYHSVIKWS